MADPLQSTTFFTVPIDDGSEVGVQPFAVIYYKPSDQAGSTVVGIRNGNAVTVPIDTKRFASRLRNHGSTGSKFFTVAVDGGEEIGVLPEAIYSYQPADSDKSTIIGLPNGETLVLPLDTKRFASRVRNLNK